MDKERNRHDRDSCEILETFWRTGIVNNIQKDNVIIMHKIDKGIMDYASYYHLLDIPFCLLFLELHKKT